MSEKERKFETEFLERKAQALAAWKSRVSITAIAKEIGVSRETVYRWVRESEVRLARKRPEKLRVDQATQTKIIEAYILLEAPSIPLLKRVCDEYFHLNLSAGQLRRLIKKWGWDVYRPSRFFNELRQKGLERSS